MVFAGYFGFLDLGIDQATTKYIAEFRSDKRMVNKVISNGVMFSLFAGLVVGGIFVFIGYQSSNWFNLNSYNEELTFKMFIVLAIYTALFWPIKLSLNILLGYEKYQFSTINSILLTTLYVIVLIISIIQGRGILFYFAGICASRLISHSILWIYFLQKEGIQIIFDFKLLRKMLSFSVYIFLTRILSMLNYQTDSLIISTHLPIERLSYYDFANKIHSIPKMGNAVLSNPVIPNASASGWKKSYMYSTVIEHGKFNVAILTGAVGTLILLMAPLYQLWLPANVIGYYYLAQAFVVYWMFNAHTGIISAIFVGNGKQKPIFYYSLVGSVLNLGLSLILVNYYDELGVILATVIANCIGIPVFLSVTLKIMEISRKDYFIKLIIPQIRSIIFFVLAYFILDYLKLELNLIGLAITALTLFMIHFITFFGPKQWLKYLTSLRKKF